MRFRTLAVAAVAVLACLAYEHRSELTTLHPSAAIMDFNKPALRFTLHSLPDPPLRRRVTTLKVHAVDADGNPADGLSIEIYAANREEGEGRRTCHTSLVSKGHGNYIGEISFEEPGVWNIDVTATKDNQNQVRQRMEIQVQSPTERTFGDDTDES